MNLKALKDDLSEYDGLSNLEGYVSTKDIEKERITQAIEGKIPQGLTSGWSGVDTYFRYKLGNLVIMNGHDNVGKSFIVWYLMAIAAHSHGWKWIMFCAENRSPDIRVQIAEFLCGSLAKYADKEDFKLFLNFAYDYFEIIEISEEKNEVETLDKILDIADLIIEEKGKFQGLLIDPYNSLQIDISKLDRRLSTHDYHYICATNLRKFAKRHNMTVWVNMHAVSEALRRVDKEGYPLPPGKADTEGGGKFANRADEFITWHRYVQDRERSLTTEMHVRKVKDTKTGGKPSDLNNPITIKWECHNKFYGFYDESGVCPLAPKTDNVPSIEKFPEAPNNFDMEKALDMIDEDENKEAPF